MEDGPFVDHKPDDLPIEIWWFIFIIFTSNDGFLKQGYPQSSSILIGFSLVNLPLYHFGIPPIDGNRHIKRSPLAPGTPHVPQGCGQGSARDSRPDARFSRGIPKIDGLQGEIPNLKWMMTGITPNSGNLQLKILEGMIYKNRLIQFGAWRNHWNWRGVSWFF